MKLSPFYQLLLLVFVTLGVYYPTLFAPFNSLDDQVFVNILMNQQGFSWARHFSPGGTYDYFRPLLSLSFEFDKSVGGLQETFMHLVNVVVHMVNVVLLWAVARRFGQLIRCSSQWLPLLAALLFALHPINTEAVNWISGRTDLLAGTFVFISLYSLLVFIDRRSLPWAGVSAIAVLGGALCKETALFLVPGACFLLLCRFKGDRTARPVRWVLPALYSMSVTLYFYLRWGAFQTDRGLGHTANLVAQAVGFAAPTAGASTTQPASFPWGDAMATTLKVSGFYALKLFQPLPLNFAIHQISPLYLLPGVVLVLCLAVLAYRRQLIGGLLLTSAALAISALLVLFTHLAWTPIAERYMYIPCGPFLIGVVYAVGTNLRFLGWQRTIMLFSFVLLGVGAWSTANRNIVWQNNLTLYQDAVRQSPDFAPAKNQLALALRAHYRYEEANEILASNSISGGGEGTFNVAAALWEEGDYVGARNYLLQYLGDNPGAHETKVLEMLVKMTSEHLDGISDENLKRNGYKEVLAWLERIKEISASGFNFYRIGRIQLVLGDRIAAQQAFAEAARRFPPDSIYKAPATKLATDLSR